MGPCKEIMERHIAEYKTAEEVLAGRKDDGEVSQVYAITRSYSDLLIYCLCFTLNLYVWFSAPYNGYFQSS